MRRNGGQGDVAALSQLAFDGQRRGAGSLASPLLARPARYVPLTVQITLAKVLITRP
jgi:hypothetical protein